MKAKPLSAFRRLTKVLGKWLKRHYKMLLLIIGGVLVAWGIVIVSVGLWYRHAHRNDLHQPGISFSADESTALGLDWHANYLGLLDDLHFKNLRLMSYWDEIEPEPGQYDFSALDWQMQQAKVHGAKVTLAVGIRQPRWPECRIPSWTTTQTDTQREAALQDYLRTVTARYKHNSALQSYQLENEIANRLFAPDCMKYDKFNRGRLSRELQTVKASDPTHPVDINASNQSGVPFRAPVGDQVGFSIYNKVWVVLKPFSFYWSFFRYTPPLWHSYRAGLVQLLHHKTTFIHELQAEPWGPTATQNMSLTEQDKTMNATLLQDNVNYAYDTGMHTVYLWGGEWWYWRKEKFNDPSLWSAAKKVTSEATQRNAALQHATQQ